MQDNPLRRLSEYGQSVWLDNLTREMIASGTLAGHLRDDNVTGITSNPSTFHEAITGSPAYDDALKKLAGENRPAGEAYEELAIEDVQSACDLLREAYDRRQGRDGFVSLEVSPHLARDAKATIEEATRLWERVGRENVFIKIPGTAEGLEAIEACLAQGVNVNITLLFSLDRYREVAEAWFRAMRTRVDRGQAPDVKSVASFFLSRIDAKVDPLLDASENPRAERLRGCTAIASAKLAYQIWKELFADSQRRWRRLREAGAMPQKLLWASTSTKDPSFHDTKYVEALIGEQTINTMPDTTLEAFRDHGKVAPTLEQDLGEQHEVVHGLSELGIDLRSVTDELVEEGIDKFAKPFDELLRALDEKLGSGVG